MLKDAEFQLYTSDVRTGFAVLCVRLIVYPMFRFSDRLLVFFADFSEEFAVPRLLDPNENGEKVFRSSDSQEWEWAFCNVASMTR